MTPYKRTPVIAKRISGVDRRRGRFWLHLPGRRHGLPRWVKVFCGRSRLGVSANPWPWASHRFVPLLLSHLSTNSFRIFCSGAFSTVLASSDFLGRAAPLSVRWQTVFAWVLRKSENRRLQSRLRFPCTTDRSSFRLREARRTSNTFVCGKAFCLLRNEYRD